jgi:hypothetical protein
MVKWLIPVAFLLLGGCVFCGGIFYGVFSVGVPSQDATPEVAAREQRDVDRAGLAMLTGFSLSALGGVGLTGVAIRRLVIR